MPTSKTTITNRLQRALLEIAECPTATVQERLDAVAIILKVKELAMRRYRTAPRKQPKPACLSTNVLGSR
jgi:hypothetical protein